jgi:hypothetical protein
MLSDGRVRVVKPQTPSQACSCGSTSQCTCQQHRQQEAAEVWLPCSPSPRGLPGEYRKGTGYCAPRSGGITESMGGGQEMSAELERKLVDAGKIILDLQRKMTVKNILADSELSRESRVSIRKQFYESLDRGEPFDVTALDEAIEAAQAQEEQQAREAFRAQMVPTEWDTKQIEDQITNLAEEYAVLTGHRHCESVLRRLGLRIGAGVMKGLS